MDDLGRILLHSKIQLKEKTKWPCYLKQDQWFRFSNKPN